jgi:dienelactone hydrolase
MRITGFVSLVVLVAAGGHHLCPARAADPLPNTKPLTLEGDIASQLVDGVDTFLLKEIDKSVERRDRHWKRDCTAAEKYNASIDPNRKRLAHILGVRDVRVPFDAPDYVATVNQPALVGKGEGYEIYAVRWPAFADVTGEGLLLVPKNGKPVANVIAIPDASLLPEQIAGLVPGVAQESQYARHLAEQGCRVLVPVLIDRERKSRRPGSRTELTSREFVYRPAFELGRHVIGYEVQKVLAGVDWFARSGEKAGEIGVIGWGDGGMLALYAGALDPRIDAVCVSGYFDDRNNVWKEPIDRNVFGLLDQFGDAELASMIAPRALIVEACKAPEAVIPGNGGAPGRLTTPKIADVRKEVARADKLVEQLPKKPKIELIVSGDGTGPFGSAEALKSFLAVLAPDVRIAATARAPEHLRKDFKPETRQERQLHELTRHTQNLLVDCAEVRKQFMNKLDTSSLEKYQQTVEPYREIFATAVIGRFEEKLLPANPRTRKFEETDKWVRYEVVLDVFPDVIAYGLLTLPKDMKDGEKRPVVVCQHGLEGRPQSTIGDKDYRSYKAFATKLAEQGFITFAPQNLYIFQDRFRVLQRKANPLGKTLFSIMVPQHQQITDWLKTLPNVDGERIAFYGLSYGGKSAMRIPPLVKNYCLSICSADFNEWVVKNASTHHGFSYVWSSEYEIFEFDLGNTFNYAEMAALIAPRPFMVERGHGDGVGVDEMVGFEWAKVYNLYDARLKIGDRAEIEWFDGPHTINEKGTYKFLHKHLKWPEK